jgi:ABC-2 type transport system permease protein
MYGAFYMARGIQSDKIDGTVVRILAGPVTMRDYFVQNFFAAMVPMTAVSVVVGALGMLLHGWEFQLTLGLILLYIMLSSTSIGLSFAWSCLFKNAETSTVVFSMLMMLVVFLSGMLLPLDVLPDILLYIGALFPGQWAVRGIESLLSYGFDGYMYWLSLLAMLMFAVAYLLYGGKRRII